MIFPIILKETYALLAERSFGIWAGKPWDEIKKRTQGFLKIKAHSNRFRHKKNLVPHMLTPALKII